MSILKSTTERMAVFLLCSRLYEFRQRKSLDVENYWSVNKIYRTDHQSRDTYAHGGLFTAAVQKTSILCLLSPTINIKEDYDVHWIHSSSTKGNSLSEFAANNSD